MQLNKELYSDMTKNSAPIILIGKKLETTTESDVDELLTNFWSGYLALSEREACLAKLNLGQNAD